MGFRNLIFLVLLLNIQRPVLSVQRLRGRYGTFKSPGYPNKYGNELNEQWDIEVRSGYYIKIQFDEFDVEESYEEDTGTCVYDYLKIEEDGEVINKFCGNYYQYPWDAPMPGSWIKTKENKTLITFISDYSNENIAPKGFQVHYVETDIDECARLEQRRLTIFEDWDLLVTCNHFCHNVPGSYYCSCRTGYTLHSNGHTCIAAFCENQELVADEGGLSSPDYPEMYSKWANCVWDIKVRDGLSIELKFDTLFEIENHYNEFCPFDNLQLTYSGKREIYCGFEAPNNGSLMELNTNHVKVEFNSDFSVENRGFNLTYTTSRMKCFQNLHDPINGHIVTDISKGFFEFEDVIEFACVRGYRIQGAQYLNCLSNGQWDYPQPTCEIKSCGRPDKLLNVPHSHIIGYTPSNPTTYLQQYTVECDKWYEQMAGAQTWVCEDDEEWIVNGAILAPSPGNLPECRPICGERLVQESLLEAQLAGAKPVKKRGAWPWMAFVDRGEGLNGNDFCGGSLIDERSVVTAAHCVHDLEDDANVLVYLGINDRIKDGNAKGFKVTEIYIHEDYSRLRNGFNFDSDIAVLKLNQSVDFSFYIRPICLPLSPEEKELPMTFLRQQEKAVITGWGRTAKGGFSEVLMKLRIPIVHPATCKLSYARLTEIDITNNMICAGTTEEGALDSCENDSGSPLMFKHGDKFYLNGVSSFGDKSLLEGRMCGRPKLFGVYTKVSNFIDWIELYAEN